MTKSLIRSSVALNIGIGEGESTVPEFPRRWADAQAGDCSQYPVLVFWGCAILDHSSDAGIV
jgi:hypothetical protein